MAEQLAMMREENNKYRDRRLTIGLTNMLILLLEKVMERQEIQLPKVSSDQNHCRRYITAVNALTISDWENEFGLPRRYLHSLRGLPKVI